MNFLNWDVMLYVTQDELSEFCESLKQFACPFCRTVGKLNRHGYLRGYSEVSSGRVVRGRRVFCNNRKRSSGCGKTFSLLLLSFIRGCIVGSKTVSELLLRLFRGEQPAGIAREILPHLSERYVYGLHSRLRLRQPFLRSSLITCSTPVENSSSNPLFQTLSHLYSIFFSKDNAVAAFQHCFQLSFL